MKRLIGMMLIGALSGFAAVYLVSNTEFSLNVPSLSFEFMMICMGIAILSIIYSLYGHSRIRAEAKKQMTGDEEDEQAALQYKRSADVALATNIALYSSLAMLALVGITSQPNAFIFISLALALVSLSLGSVYVTLAKTIEPNRDFPTVNDQQFAKKIVEMSDEGERHVMLQGMYRAFTSINLLLIFAVLALIAYSSISGVSQLFGIFTILLILTIINAQYILTIRNK